MTAGVGFGGRCFNDAAEALAAFREGFPVVTDTAAVILTGSTESGGVISFSVSRFQFSDSSTASATSAIGLTTCTAGALTLDDVYAVPSNQAAVDAWAIGFIFPMLVGVIAWGVSQIGRMLEER